MITSEQALGYVFTYLQTRTGGARSQSKLPTLDELRDLILVRNGWLTMEDVEAAVNELVRRRVVFEQGPYLGTEIKEVL